MDYEVPTVGQYTKAGLSLSYRFPSATIKTLLSFFIDVAFSTNCPELRAELYKSFDLVHVEFTLHYKRRVMDREEPLSTDSALAVGQLLEAASESLIDRRQG